MNPDPGARGHFPFRAGSASATLYPVSLHLRQHREVRTDGVARLPDGRFGVIFDWTGRYDGPKERNDDEDTAPGPNRDTCGGH
jgi:hypothetical protein